MKITYDNSIDAGYVYLGDRPVKRTIPVNEWLIVDVDCKEHIVGIEILDVSLRLSDKHLDDLKNNRLNTIPLEVLSYIPIFV